MGRENSEESSTNIQYGWAERVAKNINLISDCDYQCCEKNYVFLSKMYSAIRTCVNYTSCFIDTDKLFRKEDEPEEPGIAYRLEKVREEIDKFERFGLSFGLESERMKRNRGKKIHNELTKIYELLMEELKHHGILQYIKLNLKDVARKNWYGDVDGA